MKNYCLVLLLLIVIFGCQKDEKNIFTPKNHLKEFQTEKTQIFDLDTIEFKKIIGEKGTELYFSRDDFDVSEKQKITFELLELYDFKEILYRNISTVTTDNKLLETNGVLYISFKSDGKEIELKKNKKLVVYPPKGKLKGNHIFTAKKDALENIKWELTDQNYVTVKENKGGGIWIEKIMHRDSVAKFKEERSKFLDKLSERNYESSNFFVLMSDDFGYINIDKIVNIASKINFQLIDAKEDYSGFNIYLTYDQLKSFNNYSRDNNDLKFDSIPISGKTWMTIIGEKDKSLYYDKIELKEELNNSKIILKMKKTNRNELENLITH